MTKLSDREEKILQALPQTQCGECGYGGCQPYAAALAARKTTIDRCPPGGRETLENLAILLEINPEPYLPNMSEKARAPSLAVIRESECIGCTKCIQACPVDAIIGSGKYMHTVLSDECTGCGLCVAPCPVDCINMKTLDVPAYDKAKARSRFEAKQLRLKNSTEESNQKIDKLAYIKEALAKQQAKK